MTAYDPAEPLFPRGVAVVGLGYIGLPTCAILADRGVRVHGVDVDHGVVEAVNSGTVHFVEPDLDELVHRVVHAGMLTATSEVVPADVHVLAVPTPFVGDHQPDLRHVEAASRAVATVLRPGDLVILESTVPPGATASMSRWIAEERPDLRMPHEHPDASEVFVAHAPERVLPGNTLRELVANDRVIGGLDAESGRQAAALYETFVEGRISVTDAATAEMAKLVENTFRDVNIAFANELSSVCDRLGLDVWSVIELANHHPRVNVLQPGPGVGGHCIAVDPWFIVAAAPEESPLIRQARAINDDRPWRVAERIALSSADGAKVACLGLAFKPDVDDLRQSPAVDVVRRLTAQRPDLELLAVDPYATRLPQVLDVSGRVRLCGLEEALVESSVVVLLVHHAAFVEVDPDRLAGKEVIDTRGVWRALGER